MPKDYYAVLSVDRQATTEEIRARFQELARTKHPDLFHGPEKGQAEEAFQGITEAFNILTNPERRRRHDLDLSQPESQGQAMTTAQLARVYLQRGIKAYKEKNYFEAAENFDRATHTEPTNPQPWYYLALTCQQQPRWLSRGMSAIAKACELEKMNAQYHKLAGRLFTQGGMSIRAERYYRQALRWGGEDPEILQALEDLKKSR
jgi:curved DNA-binding protein CbpA